MEFILHRPTIFSRRGWNKFLLKATQAMVELRGSILRSRCTHGLLTEGNRVPDTACRVPESGTLDVEQMVERLAFSAFCAKTTYGEHRELKMSTNTH